MAESESSLPALRASDAERERAAEVLREAMTSGRLGIDELDDRMRRVLGAQTRVDLEQLVADVTVPADDRHPLAAPGTGSGARTARVPVLASGESTHRIVAVLGGSERKGRWRLATDCSVTCVLGGVELDLTQVELAGDSVELSIFCLLGGTEVTLPPHLNVRITDTAILGGNNIDIVDETPDPGGPVVHIKLTSILGGSEVKRTRQAPSGADHQQLPGR
jgi:Domain of unknown function (DUF1707)